MTKKVYNTKGCHSIIHLEARLESSTPIVVPSPPKTKPLGKVKKKKKRRFLTDEQREEKRDKFMKKYYEEKKKTEPKFHPFEIWENRGRKKPK